MLHGWFTLKGPKMSTDQIIKPAYSSPWFKLGLFSCLFTLVVFLQYLSGTYRSEFAGYPDEPAHYVTSVMVRDYLISGQLSHPMQFANNYYKQYPKVAFGHWPPLLYTVQGAWMLVFSESRTSVLVELALTTTLAAFLLFLVAARHFGTSAGVLASVVLVCLPIIQTYSDEEMAESLLLVTGFGAALFFYRYLEDKKWQNSFWFGIFCSLAILTKGNGWALAMIPPIAAILTRDLAILKRRSFWIPVPIVAVLCLPWQLLTLEMAHRGWTGGQDPNLRYTAEALVQFGVVLHDLVGSAIIVLAVWGIWLCVIAPYRAKRVQPLDAVMLGLLVSIWFFHSVVPAGVEQRKMIDAIPAVLLFALAGGQWIAQRISDSLANSWSSRGSAFAVASLVVLLFSAETFEIPKEQHYGFTEASRFIESKPELSNSVILVSSERDGEGLLISELLMLDGKPRHTILRANKELSSSDWNGNVSQEFCSSTQDVMNFIKNRKVRMVVLDTYPRRVHYLHNQLIRDAIRTFPTLWRLAATFGEGKVQIYEVKN